VERQGLLLSNRSFPLGAVLRTGLVGEEGGQPREPAVGTHPSPGSHQGLEPRLFSSLLPRRIHPSCFSSVPGAGCGGGSHPGVTVWWARGTPVGDARSPRLPRHGENCCRNVFPRVSPPPGARRRPRSPGREVMEGCCRWGLDGPRGERGTEPPSAAAAGRAGLAVSDFDLLRVRHSRLFPSL